MKIRESYPKSTYMQDSDNLFGEEELGNLRKSKEKYETVRRSKLELGNVHQIHANLAVRTACGLRKRKKNLGKVRTRYERKEK